MRKFLPLFVALAMVLSLFAGVDTRSAAATIPATPSGDFSASAVAAPSAVDAVGTITAITNDTDATVAVTTAGVGNFGTSPNVSIMRRVPGITATSMDSNWTRLGDQRDAFTSAWELLVGDEITVAGSTPGVGTILFFLSGTSGVFVRVTTAAVNMTGTLTVMRPTSVGSVNSIDTGWQRTGSQTITFTATAALHVGDRVVVHLVQYPAVSTPAILTVGVTGSGSLAKSPDLAGYLRGTSVQLTATPAVGWHFVAWSGDLVGSTNPTTITMDADKTLSALFVINAKRVIKLRIGESTMYVDGNPVALEVAPIILNSRTLLPIRALLEEVGGVVAWNVKSRQATLEARSTTIVLTTGKAMALVNGHSLVIDPENAKVVPLIMSGCSMLPLRFVVENLGLQVVWNGMTRTITLTWDA